MKLFKLSAIIMLISAILALFVDLHATYDPATGRFLQQDSIGTKPVVLFSKGGPRFIFTNGPIVPNSDGTKKTLSQYIDGMNLYEYVKSNPIMLTDPTGGCSKKEEEKYFKQLQKDWGQGGTSKGNCYRFACDDPAGPGENPFENPGNISGNQSSRLGGGTNYTLTCSDVIAGAKTDGMTDVPSCGKCLAGSRKVGVAVSSAYFNSPGSNNWFNDYHWWREEAPGKWLYTWTHKPGNTEVRCKDPKNQYIDDPSKPEHRDPGTSGAINYDQWCGFLCAPSGMDVD
ncbi:MAG: hypothetical protein JEZ07_12475 [Phycisphaerae bacterium]|nr:hypothetical protein [Phycisphaerae bacterium]